MRKRSIAMRTSAILLALALVFSGVLSVYAGSTVDSFLGDGNKRTVIVELTCSGGGTIVYDVAGESGSTTSSYYNSYTPIAQESNATAVGTDTHPFLYWKDNFSGRVYSFEEKIYFTTASRVSFTAVFSNATANQHSVQYVNYGGNTLLTDIELAKGTQPSPPMNPNMPGFTFTGWSMTPQQVAASDENLLVTANFTVNNEHYTVTITNDAYVTGAGTYSNFQTVNLTAKEKNGSGQTFSYWKTADDEIVSFDRNYSFRINYNVTLTAVYGETVTAVPVIRTTKIVRDATNQRVTFYAERSVPQQYTVVSHGMLVSVNAKIKDNMMRVGYAQDTNTALVRKIYGTSNENCGTFSLTKTAVTDSTTVTTRNFIICIDSAGNESIVYGDIERTTLTA